MSTVAERVAASAALLDEKAPGWWQADAARPIDLAALDLYDCQDCVLGQKFRTGQHDADHCGYNAGLEALGITGESAALVYAFDPDWDEREAVAAEWARVIAELRTGAAA